MNNTEIRLSRLRGSGPAGTHNARTIAALSTNPGCHRRSVLDAAGINKQQLAGRVGYPAPFGQSPFAITRGNAFEAQVKANGCAELLRLMREEFGLTIPEVAYADLGKLNKDQTRSIDTNEARYLRTRQMLARAARAGDDAGTLFDHPLLRLDVAGQWAYLEPDLIILFRVQRRFYVVEIKSFAVIDGQAPAANVTPAVTQAGVYVLAMQQLLDDLGLDRSSVCEEVLLVCPKDFTNRPTGARVDVRQKLTVLRRQLQRLRRLETILATLPQDLTLDLWPDYTGRSTRPAGELEAALDQIEAHYQPGCLTSCEMAYFCRAKASGRTASLGLGVQEDLGGVESVAAVVGLSTGAVMAADEQVEAARLLQLADRLRRDFLGGAA